MNTLGDRLRELRIEKELEQKELAKILNVHKGTVSNWENNKRTPDKETLSKISDFFNVTIDYLLCATDERNKKELSHDEELAVLLIDTLKKDGYEITKDDIPNLILASKIALAHKNKQD